MTLTRETIRAAMAMPKNKALIAHSSILNRLATEAPEYYTHPNGNRQPCFAGIQTISSDFCVETKIDDDKRKQDRRKNNRIQARRIKRNRRLGERRNEAVAYIIDMAYLKIEMDSYINKRLLQPSFIGGLYR